MMRSVNVAKEFSRSPAGRYRSDGPYSGEEFREKCLKPALEQSESIEVDLSGALGYGSSFLEEAFGGLVRECGYSSADLRRKLRIKSDLKTYENRIWRYVDEAGIASNRQR